MKKYMGLKFVLATLLAFCLAACSESKVVETTESVVDEQPWNIVLVVVDDVAWNQVGYQARDQ